ncbi:SLC13 family permease [Halomarina halobia]|uniref:SLC13 family permease n=1 Tax=Halomarina halobia TaxID=3033386 RepID=A0ABD6ACG0_9EURY|nr:SLC13 family permease [Halomarina sp. PSR21]
MLVVFGITLLAFLLFASEVVPVDVTALITMALLMILEPWTRISIDEGISGFSNEATITVLAMFILSAGISRTGAVQMLSRWMASYAGTDERKQLLAVIGVAGLPSAVLNNTPIVAMLIPAVSDLARGGGTSPSKLLIPLSYSAMVGGMLTLIGTSTNIVASDVSRRLLGHPFSMFEFTVLGAIVFVTGTVYLVLVGQRLLPERIDPDEGLLEEYEMEGYLTEVVVDEDSPLLGESVDAILEETDLDVEVIQLIRDGERYIEPFSEVEIRAGDVFIVRANLATVQALIRAEGLSFASPDVTEEELEAVSRRKTLVELVIPAQSRLVGASLSESLFRERYDANVLAIRRERTLLHNRLDELLLRGGDTLLVQATEESLNALATDPDVIVAHQVADPDYRTGKIPVAVAIIGSVVGLAALGVVDILVAALSGVILMLFTGVLNPDELYDAIEWNVIFLLAGLIPLGIAFEETGAAALIGALVAQSGTVLPPIGVLWLFYVVTALTTALVSNAGSVVLLIPVGVATAAQIGADPFAFVLAVTFAASADFMTPIGYQTNLLVYGPGGYRFTDYFRVGAPLQVLLSVATVVGIALIWGVT